MVEEDFSALLAILNLLALALAAPLDGATS